MQGKNRNSENTMVQNIFKSTLLKFFYVIITFQLLNNSTFVWLALKRKDVLIRNYCYKDHTAMQTMSAM